MDDAVLGDAVLDGNAIGGMLIEVFGTEMTTTGVTCVDLEGLAGLG